MTDADTLTRAAEYLEAMTGMYPQSPRRADLADTASRLREMARRIDEMTAAAESEPVADVFVRQRARNAMKLKVLEALE